MTSGEVMKENIKYMLKNWIAWDKKSLIYFLIRVPALVFQPIVTAYIPKAMIDCINDGVTVGRLILVVALLSVLVALTTACTLYAGAFKRKRTHYPYALCRFGFSQKS